MPLAHDPLELSAWLRLSLEPGLNPADAYALLGAVGLPQHLYAHPVAELAQWVPGPLARQLAAPPVPALAARIAAALEWVRQPDHHLLCLADPDYPRRLLEVGDPPLLLYIHGDPSTLSRPSLAIVGARNASLDGRDNAQAFAHHLAAQGWCIVSGMAAGIDAAAHEGALEAARDANIRNGRGNDETARNEDICNWSGHDEIARAGSIQNGRRDDEIPRNGSIQNGSRNDQIARNGSIRNGSLGSAGKDRMAADGSSGGGTIAVLGTGIDVVYPSHHQALAARIAQTGALVSEFPLGTPALPHHFPRRNRVVAGLVRGVLVVEAASRSGSLITARLAGEYGREVFAIPGSIHSPLKRGCHALIRQGAKLVECAQDITDELQGSQKDVPRAREQKEVPRQAALIPDDPSAATLLACMSHDPMHRETLLQHSGLSSAGLDTALLRLELAGLVARRESGYFQRIPSKSAPPGKD